MIRIGIVDDHPAMILGTSAILNMQTDMHVAAAAPTVAELLAQTVDLDLVMLDLVLEDNSTPASNAATLHEQEFIVLAYTSGERSDLIQQVIRGGAAGLVRKSERPESLLAAIRAAAAGETVTSAEWASALDDDEDFVRAELSPRETEVLVLYASGATAEMVASQLFIARSTVIDHIRNIRAKYIALGRDVSGKTGLYQRAHEDGLM